MNNILKPQLLAAGTLLLAAAGLAMYGQPDLERKWQYLAPEYESRLTDREVFIDPAELLHLINDDYMNSLSTMSATNGTGTSSTSWMQNASP